MTLKTVTRRIGSGFLLICVGLLIASGIFMYWVVQFPNSTDPGNIDYVLWKHELNKNMDLDAAVSAMTHDAWAVRLVEGRTKEQLVKRFGFLRTYAQARLYDQLCVDNPRTIRREFSINGS